MIVFFYQTKLHKLDKGSYSIDVLKKAGVDMTNKDAMQKAMDVARGALEDLRKAIL